ncbi:MAG: hypothetical protein J5817_01615 [Treponema sp.]|nr:hypothetical protein [Treponema sp.]
MSYETVIEQVKATPAEFLDEISLFLNFLQYRKQQSQSNQKMPDETYNRLVNDMEESVTSSARATIWEQIKDDTW